jgi:predicted ArsR family transcriptional regulator
LLPFGIVTLFIVEPSRAGPRGETIDTPRHRALGSATRVEILRLVRADTAGITAGALAERTGLHLSSVRAHLDRLTEAGLLVRARPRGAGVPGRPPWRYRAAPTDPSPAPAPYRVLSAALLDDLSASGEDTAAAATRAGHRWGRQLAAASTPGAEPVDAVLSVLTALGFAPGRRPDRHGTEVHLHTCPFLELVAEHPDAMCGLHLGVIRGVLERAGAPSTAATLEPFGAPTACVVRLPDESPAGSRPGGPPGIEGEPVAQSRSARRAPFAEDR